MKARVIYKSGREGEKTLDAIQGIAVPMINGKEGIVFPKYAELPLLEGKDIEKWDARAAREFDALRGRVDITDATDGLAKVGSPAAKFVQSLGCVLPGLLELEAIVNFRPEIDALAKEIDGADLLGNYGSNYWSCFRYSDNYAWYAYGGVGFFGNYVMYGSYLAVPVSLYNPAKQA